MVAFPPCGRRADAPGGFPDTETLQCGVCVDIEATMDGSGRGRYLQGPVHTGPVSPAGRHQPGGAAYVM